MRLRFMILVPVVAALMFSAAAFAQNPVVDSPAAGGPDPAPAKQDSGPAKSKAKGQPPKTQKTGAGAQNSRSTPDPEALKAQPELDRRWIIKMKDEKGQKTLPRKPEAIAWTGKAQQATCEAYLPVLQETFGKTRYYSVGGDSCNAAGSARAFLEAVKNCERDCPPGYLKAKGYTPQVIRNIEIVQQLGQKQCLEPVMESGPVTRRKTPAQKAGEKPAGDGRSKY